MERTGVRCLTYGYRNVDRLFAIWQAIYPNSYTTPEVNAEGTFTIAPGSNDTINSRTSTPSQYLPLPYTTTNTA